MYTKHNQCTPLTNIIKNSQYQLVVIQSTYVSFSLLKQAALFTISNRTFYKHTALWLYKGDMVIYDFVVLVYESVLVEQDVMPVIVCK